MNRFLLLVRGAGSLLLVTIAVGCSPATRGNHPAFTSSHIMEAKFAARAADRTRALLAAGQPAAASAAAEIWVAAAATDPEARLLLGRAYLASGRFASAEAAFGDALTLRPDLPSASLGRALALIALGRSGEARSMLAGVQDRLPAADVGLALAIGGDARSAVALLDRAARLEGADSRTRQNLALAHALAGDWEQARVIAARDVGAAELPARMAAWAAFAKPRDPSDRVAALLGTAVQVDPGMPPQLALADRPAIAPASPAPVEASASATTPAAMAAPVALAAPVRPLVAAARAEPVSIKAPRLKPVVSLALAAPGSARVSPVPLVAPRMPAAPVPPLLRAPPAPVRLAAAMAARPTVSARGGFVVQLGAFSTATGAERGWGHAIGRFSNLGGFTPSRATYVSATRSARLVRLSIAGFATRDEAQTVCARVRSAGGACFVRQNAGDRPIQWVSREGPPEA